MSGYRAVTGSSGQAPSAHSRRDSRDCRIESLRGIPKADVDLTAHVFIDRLGLPRATPSAAHPAEPLDRACTPGARAGLAAGLMLALRFVQARVLSIWGLIVAVALCPAQAFADFAIYSTLANFIAIAALLRFEAVFFQNSDSVRLGRAVRLSVAVGLAFLCLSALLIVAAEAAGWILASYGGLFLISLAGRAVMRLVSSEATAEGDFAALGNANILQALVQPVAMLLLIWLLEPSAWALIAADAIGHTVAAAYLVWRRRASLWHFVVRDAWSLPELARSAGRWRLAPGLLLPSALFSFGFTATPLLALPLLGDPLLVAHVALAMRLLDVPTQMFNAVSVPLVMSHLRHAPPARRQGRVRLITLALLASGCALFATIGLAAWTADPLLAGTEWAGAGSVVAIMAIFYTGIALVLPLHEMASLARRPQSQVATNAVALLAAAALISGVGTFSLLLLLCLCGVSLGRLLAHICFAWTRFGVDDGFGPGEPLIRGG